MKEAEKDKDPLISKENTKKGHKTPVKNDDSQNINDTQK
jgi:hypothetical protein